MKKTYSKLMWTILFSITPLILLLSIYSYKQHKGAYNFKRQLRELIDGPVSFDIKSNAYKIVSKVKDSIYLATGISPGHLLRVNESLTDTQHLSITVKSIDFKSQGLYDLYINSTDFYLSNGPAAQILYGKTGIWRTEIDSIPTPYFLQAIPLTPNSIIFKYLNSVTNTSSIRKEMIHKKALENSNLLKKQIDGLFCTDGTFHLNRQINRLVYTYRYRNEVLIIDTNLNLVRRIKTIDPIDTAKIEVKKITSTNSVTLGSNPLMVNLLSASWNKYLFIHSKLMGKGEEELLFKNSSAFDVYDIEKGIYLFSFYIPLYLENPIHDFYVDENYILTITDHYIVKYPIRTPIETLIYQSKLKKKQIN